MLPYRQAYNIQNSCIKKSLCQSFASSQSCCLMFKH